MATDPNDDAMNDLLRALRTRVPVDAAELLAQESPERIVAALEALPPGLAHRIARELPENLRPAVALEEDATTPGQVSELMDSARGVVKSGTSVQQAIEWLREAESVSDITYLYVVDDTENLLGLVVMRDLLLAQLSQTVNDIMIRKPFSFAPTTPIADAIKAAVRRHYPVFA